MPLQVTHDGQRWSNAESDHIELCSYDPFWPVRFAEEAATIQGVLTGEFSYSLEHVGSTAIPGLVAKPIIDIILIVPARERWPSLIEPLQRLGYVYWAENPEKSKMFFVKGMPPFGAGRTHHVHVHIPADARAKICFRDYLIGHPEEAVRYAALKRELAARFPTDRDAYTQGKAEFVREVLRKASYK